MAEGSQQPSPTGPAAAREVATWVLMMVGGAFIPGLVIALCVVVILVIVHLAG